MKTQLHTLALLTLFSCSGNEKSTQTTRIGSTESTVATDTLQPPVALSEKPSPTKGSVNGADAWKYEKTTDKEGHPVYKASIASPNLLEFGFPYAGGSVATLTIRKRESGTHVYIGVSKGQFNRSFQGGRASVRFDEKPAISYSFSAAENGSANIIFFDSDQALINTMKTARKMTVNVDFAGQGQRQIEFQIAGLRWNH